MVLFLKENLFLRDNRPIFSRFGATPVPDACYVNPCCDRLGQNAGFGLKICTSAQLCTAPLQFRFAPLRFGRPPFWYFCCLNSNFPASSSRQKASSPSRRNCTKITLTKQWFNAQSCLVGVPTTEKRNFRLSASSVLKIRQTTADGVAEHFVDFRRHDAGVVAGFVTAVFPEGRPGGNVPINAVSICRRPKKMFGNQRLRE